MFYCAAGWEVEQVGRPGREGSAGESPKRGGRKARGAAGAGDRVGTRAGTRAGKGERGSAFYAELFTADELADLARVDRDLSLEEEIGLLRVAIRRAFAEGESLETVSRSVQRLAQALKTERQLQGQGIRNLEEALARVLDELGAELERPKET